MKYGWIPQKKDHRDFKYKFKNLEIPRQVDLRPLCSPVENQSELGSCTANACVGADEFIVLKLKRHEFADISRLFVYWCTRAIEGDIGEDSGATLRSTIKSLYTFGACTESSWPYDVSKFAKIPPFKCFVEAQKHVITCYDALEAPPEMLECLASGYPFVFGFWVFESFDSIKEDGIMPMPQEGEGTYGGHAVMAVGYDLDKNWVIVRNSWGTEFGDKGYFYMPIPFISNPGYCSDFWQILRER